ncbi:MAG TPA: NADH-quinone oxidoreductase subunit L [candidate division Zixibacteria bacterium]|nr:NADH-quinone oxidoreductase subunit L [candidate division Zixibacteria bacterium]
MSEETLVTMTWLIPAAPMLVFFLVVLFTNRNKTLSWLLAWGGVFTALILGWTVAMQVVWEFFQDPHHLAEHPVVIADSFAWLPAGLVPNWLRMGISVDALTAVMLMMVTTTVTGIFIYSVGYHRWGEGPGTHPEPGKPNHDGVEPLFSRFFAFMSLFAGAMLLLVVSDNLLMLFIGWELMGLCSYLLIGFWYAKKYDDPKQIRPKTAAVKAFMTTRIGDVVMLMGIVFFYRVFGTLNFSEALSAESLEHGVELVGAASIGLMVLLLFAGTVGKSAQWPLHVWLPDAMEGPTPVSAVIHAAAMVSAGVYLIIRIFPLIAVAIDGIEGVEYIIAGIGAFTALMAATIAVAQKDVKRVLAYSTISQLGYMVAAIGIGAYIPAAFHLITHGFFKALLFLGSGSIIHGMEHGAAEAHDHHTDPQDMANMGGLRHKMPATFWTFLIAGLALSGFPLITAGFWSKDEILAEIFHEGQGEAFAFIIFWMLVIGALLTAFYTARQITMVFLGKPRTSLAERAHESNKFMTIPLIALSAFALLAGFPGVPEDFPILGPLFKQNFFHDFVGTTIEETMVELFGVDLIEQAIESVEFNPFPVIMSIAVVFIGLGGGWWIYSRKFSEAGQPDPLERPLGPLYNFLKNKWYWDELYDVLFIRPTKFFSRTVVYEWIDRGIIDGTLHLIARSVYAFGRYLKRFEEVVISGGVDWVKDQVLVAAQEFRALQTGKIQEYVLVSVLIGWALAVVVLLINSGLFDGLFN